MEGRWRWVIQLHYFESDAALPLCGIAAHQAIAFEIAQHSNCPKCQEALEGMANATVVK